MVKWIGGEVDRRDWVNSTDTNPLESMETLVMRPGTKYVVILTRVLGNLMIGILDLSTGQNKEISVWCAQRGVEQQAFEMLSKAIEVSYKAFLSRKKLTYTVKHLQGKCDTFDGTSGGVMTLMQFKFLCVHPSKPTPSLKGIREKDIRAVLNEELVTETPIYNPNYVFNDCAANKCKHEMPTEDETLPTDPEESLLVV